LYGHRDTVRCIAFITQKLIISGSWDYTLRIWDITTGEMVGEPLRGHTGYISCVIVSPNGHTIASCGNDRTIRLWKFHQASNRSTSCWHVMKAEDEGWVWSIAFSPDGMQIISVSYTQMVRVWSVATGQQIRKAIRCHNGPITSIALSPDGKRAISGSWDHSVKMWDTTNWCPASETKMVHTGTIIAVVFSPDSTSFASASEDSTIIIWDAVTCHTKHTFSVPTGATWSVAYSPSGKYLAASGHSIIYIWNIESGSLIGVLKGHHDLVCSVAFSPDGTRLLSGSKDCTVRIWDRIYVEDESLSQAYGTTISEYGTVQTGAVPLKPLRPKWYIQGQSSQE
ncbi:WD40 repeat-like protein, partial [Auricularia subglabra TFB-10046 SS5]